MNYFLFRKVVNPQERMTLINEVLNAGSSSKHLMRGKSKFVASQPSALTSKLAPKLSPMISTKLESSPDNHNSMINPALSSLLTHPSTYSNSGRSQSSAIGLPVSIRKSPPSFYQKLNSYFPGHEMKKLEHFLLLLRDKSHIYKVQETNDYVVVYSVIGEYLFVDYVWVSESARGNGIGAKIIRDLKKLNKVIILEVEQIDKSVAADLKRGAANELTLQDEEYIQKVHAVKRLKFYKREGFHHANRIRYSRKAFPEKPSVDMEILFWDPKKNYNQHEILLAMRVFYDEIHRYKDYEVYGRVLEAPEIVLQFRTQIEDMMLHV